MNAWEWYIWFDSTSFYMVGEVSERWEICEQLWAVREGLA